MEALGDFLCRVNDEIEDVRMFKKCDCELGGGFHECRVQSWWPRR